MLISRLKGINVDGKTKATYSPTRRQYKIAGRLEENQ